jgi:hypothetical protein
MITKINFYDFDGTFCHSPLPEVGKPQWSAYHKVPYPHVGWWGRAESLDMDALDIKLRDDVHADYLKHEKLPHVNNYILTSRMPKLKHLIEAILKKNGVEMCDILCAHGSLNKGERIVKVLTSMTELGHKIDEINFWEDRNKEVVFVEGVRKHIEDQGVKLNIYKIQSDATD